MHLEISRCTILKFAKTSLKKVDVDEDRRTEQVPTVFETDRDHENAHFYIALNQREVCICSILMNKKFHFELF